MNRLIVLTGVLACAIVASTSPAFAEDKDEAVKTGAIMKKCFGKGGLCATCINQGKKMDWDEAAKTAKEFYECIEKLPKGEPKKGEKDDFVKAAKAFVGKVKDMKTAVDDKDGKKFTAAVKGVQGSCKACHTAHR
jgi:cytochrome c556